MQFEFGNFKKINVPALLSPYSKRFLNGAILLVIMKTEKNCKWYIGKEWIKLSITMEKIVLKFRGPMNTKMFMC